MPPTTPLRNVPASRSCCSKGEVGLFEEEDSQAGGVAGSQEAEENSEVAEQGADLGEEELDQGHGDSSPAGDKSSNPLVLHLPLHHSLLYQDHLKVRCSSRLAASLVEKLGTLPGTVWQCT